MKRILIFISLIFIGLTLTSCNLPFFNNKTNYSIRFYDEELVKEVTVEENDKLDYFNLNEKEGYDFLGWYKSLEDENSKWDFDNDLVSGNIDLYAKWKFRDDYLTVTNVSLVGSLLMWDHIEEAKYLINDILIEENSYDLTKLNLIKFEEREITIKVQKENYFSLDYRLTIVFTPSEIIESERVDFEPFDYDDFKELNRSTYKSVEIDFEDFHLDINEGRLTNKSEIPKENEVALILREEGFIEFKEMVANFEKITFKMAAINLRKTTSTVSLLARNDNDNEWILVNEFSAIENEFLEIVVLKEDLNEMLNGEKIYFKIAINKTDQNIVLDDIVIYEKVNEYYQIKNVALDDFTLSDYYKSAEGLKGEKLVFELRRIVSSNLNDIRYKDIKEVLEFSDVDLTNNNVVVGIYDDARHKANWGSKSEWHREHVWPNSRLGMDRVKENEVNQGSDPHNLRAITPSTNSSRSNRYYDNSSGDNILGHTIGTAAYYPGDDDKGDVARILMYMVIRYEFLGLTDSKDLLGLKAYSEEAAFMGLLSLLLDWHKEDPVNDFEKNRNEIIFGYQNNRNPFIDHPELFEEVFNYYISIDENRVIGVYVFKEIIIDFNDLKKRFLNL